MTLKEFIANFVNIGVKSGYQPWEIHLTRKLNIMALVGFVNVILGISVFLFFGYYEFIPECILVLIIAPLVLIFNVYRNYIWSAYTFYFNGWLLFSIFSLKMGIDSFAFLLFFPVILSLMQLFGRSELIKHLIANLLICFVFIMVSMIGGQKGWFYIHPKVEMVKMLKYINAFFSFTVTFWFLIILTIESMRQEKLIANVLKEKEILLAEVFHRVKNNMNIVTSLLNLKKNSSDSKEVQDALEECRNRVFSMALVHQNIYNTQNLTNLDLKEYMHDLVDELLNSVGNDDKIEIHINSEPIELELTYAIPIGLILNELITNSFKYAVEPPKKLRIDIDVRMEGQSLILKVKDNGSGLVGKKEPNHTGLGMDLIKSLSEQIDGEYHFSTNNGLVFDLKFPIKTKGVLKS